MKEVKTPRKPFIFYYIIVLLVLMLVNMFVMPMIREASIKKVDYNEFMNMTLNKQIKKVEIDDSQITFTDQNGTVYKTSKMDGDWGLTERLYRSGAEFTTQVQEQMSPIILPVILDYPNCVVIRIRILCAEEDDEQDVRRWSEYDVWYG